MRLLRTKTMGQFSDKPSLPKAVASLTIIIGAMNSPTGEERQERKRLLLEKENISRGLVESGTSSSKGGSAKSVYRVGGCVIDYWGKGS